MNVVSSATPRDSRHNRRTAWRSISPTRDEARWIAATVAKLPGLLAAARTASGTAAKGEPTSDEWAESDGLLTPEEEELPPELRRRRRGIAIDSVIHQRACNSSFLTFSPVAVSCRADADVADLHARQQARERCPSIVEPIALATSTA